VWVVQTNGCPRTFLLQSPTLTSCYRYTLPPIDTPPHSPPHLQPTTTTGSVLAYWRGYSDMASSTEDIESVRIRADRVVAKQSRDTLPQDIRVSASPQGPHLPIGHQDFADEVRSVSLHSASGANDVGLHCPLHTYLGGNHSLPSLPPLFLLLSIYLSIYSPNVRYSLGDSYGQSTAKLRFGSRPSTLKYLNNFARIQTC